MSPDRDRSHLHPLMRERAEALDAELARRGLPFHLHEGFRGRARQEDGRARRTSSAGWLSSWHNYGLAVDYVGSDPPRGRTGKPDPWHPKLPWSEYGEAVEAVGLSWSGRWTGPLRELVHADASPYYAPGGRGPLVLGSLADDAHGDIDGLWEWLAWWLTLPDMRGTITQTAAAQRLLRRAGHDPGPIDGIWGRRSAAALENALGAQWTPGPRRLPIERIIRLAGGT